MPLGSSTGACFPAPASSRPFGAIRLIGPPSSIKSFLGAGLQTDPPHLGHFSRLVLAAKPHDAHIQFISTPSLRRLFDSAEVSIQLLMWAVKPNTSMGNTGNYVAIFEEPIVMGIPRLGPRWASSPTPIQLLVVLDHEVKVVCGWKINSTGDPLTPPKFHHRLKYFRCAPHRVQVASRYGLPIDGFFRSQARSCLVSARHFSQ